jgi:CheY-like chemotaxis protein
MRILVVDDDPLAGEMTAAVLEDGGHEVVTVENGIEAVETLGEDAAFDMVVSDMHMPLVSGIDLYRNLRDNGMRIPFLLLTGDAPGPLLAKEPGMEGCLAKDGSLEDSLPAAVAAVSARRGRAPEP